jgi:hypothetical protein
MQNGGIGQIFSIEGEQGLDVRCDGTCLEPCVPLERDMPLLLQGFTLSSQCMHDVIVRA